MVEGTTEVEIAEEGMTGIRQAGPGGVPRDPVGATVAPVVTGDPEEAEEEAARIAAVGVITDATIGDRVTVADVIVDRGIGIGVVSSATRTGPARTGRICRPRCGWSPPSLRCRWPRN